MFINKHNFIISDNNYNLKKFCNKLNISLIPIKIDNSIFIRIVKNIEIISIKNQQETTFHKTCYEILSKKMIFYLKNNFYDFNYLLKLDTYNANILIKKNYINTVNFFIFSECSYIILKKMRLFFYKLNGQIYNNNNIQNFYINDNNQLIVTVNNRIWLSNIIISTISSNKLSNIYNWSIENYNLLKNNIKIKKNNLDNLILNKCNISLPCNISDHNNKKFNINFFINSNIHFYICHSDFNKNPMWIYSIIDTISDIIKTI
jgi:hypothetical protein